MRRKIFCSSMILTLCLFAFTAWVSFELSAQKIDSERSRLLEHIKLRVMNNVVTMFEQTEKIALLISENKDLISMSTNHYEEANAELERIKMVEETLSGTIFLNPHIETIIISLKNGRSYMSTTRSISAASLRLSNVYGLPQFDKVHDNQEGVWLPPGTFTLENEVAEAKYFRILFENRYTYSKKIDDEMIVTLVVDSKAIQLFLNQPDSTFAYEMSVENSDLSRTQAGVSDMVNERYGFEIKPHIVDSDYKAIKLQNVKILIAACIVLMLIAALSSSWFSLKMASPIQRMKRQVADIHNLENSSDIMLYKVKRKIPISFRLKLSMYLVTISLVGIAVIFIVNYYYATLAMKDQVKKYYFEYLFQSENSIEFNLKNSERFSTAILLDRKLQQLMQGEGSSEDVAKELIKQFSYQHIISKNINYVNIYNQEGEMVFSTILSFLNQQAIQKTAIYPLLEKSNGETIYFNERRDPFGDHVISIAKKINSTQSSSKLIGYYLLAVNEAEFKFLGEDLGIPSLNFIVADSNREIIYNKKDAAMAEQILAVDDIFHQDKGIVQRTIQGREKLLMHDALGETQWKVIGSIDTKDIFQSQREITLVYGYLLLVILILISGAIYLIARSISEPVQQLAMRIRNMIQGGFQDKHFPVIQSTDEIAELSVHLYAMIEKIQKLMSDIYTFEVKAREIELQFKQAELANLMKQINPHFLYNTLETIKWMAMELTNGENKASGMIHELSAFLRSSLQTDMKMTTIEEEISRVKAYLYIQQIRYGDKLKVKWAISPSAAKQQVIKFILQPLVENALIHGIDLKKGKGVIFISIQMVQQRLIVSVIDNGAGIEAAKLSAIHASLHVKAGDAHIGLRNISQRLHLIYGEKAVMQLHSKVLHWTKATIEIGME
ncbi:sensor histidine kinase [Paenibacillus eucommiae]|uniref:Sensor histidine kinase YesM n=1 Tax=Paenibacillus eucommiae TaxID=1355755 RepID=A0ABS4IVU3_9BACL|nr:histidine kinase [Paenibacillus eucommiae]MBP1990659.1 sensor histidine kinase YesM [Paenibacillus eucommiae]